MRTSRLGIWSAIGAPIDIPLRTPLSTSTASCSSRMRPAAAEATLPTPQLAVDQLHVEFDTRRQAVNQHDKGLPVRFTGGVVR